MAWPLAPHPCCGGYGPARPGVPAPPDRSPVIGCPPEGNTMYGRSYAPRCLALLSIVALSSAASAASFIALDFGNPAGPTPPSQVFSIDPVTGAATPIGFAGVNRLNELA